MLGALGLYELAAFEMPNVCIFGGGRYLFRVIGWRSYIGEIGEAVLPGSYIPIDAGCSKSVMCTTTEVLPAVKYE